MFRYYKLYGIFFDLTIIELLRFGVESSGDSLERLEDLLRGMSESQVNLVKDFILLVRKHL